MKKLILGFFLTSIFTNIALAKLQQRKIALLENSNVEIYIEVIKKQSNCVGKCFEGKTFDLQNIPNSSLIVNLGDISCRFFLDDLTSNVASGAVTLEEQGKIKATVQLKLNPVHPVSEELFDEVLLKGSGEAVCAVSLCVK